MAQHLQRLISQVQGHLKKPIMTYYFHPRGPGQKNHTLSFLLDYHGNEGAIQEQKAAFAVGKVWKKASGQCPYESGAVGAGKRG